MEDSTYPFLQWEKGLNVEDVVDVTLSTVDMILGRYFQTDVRVEVLVEKLCSVKDENVGGCQTAIVKNETLYEIFHPTTHMGNGLWNG